jgi:OmpA-OmpF porin, OOP family
MAASQFLRPGSLIDAVRGSLTPDVVRSASSLIGEPESSTRQALSGAVPSVLGGLVNMVSTKDGAGNLAGLIRDGGYGAVADNARSLFSGGSATTNMLASGQQLLGTIFGSRSSAVTDQVAKSAGVSSISAGKLMSLAAPLVLGVLGKRATAQGLSSSGLANALLNEKSEIASALPSGVAQIFSGGPTAVSTRTETVRDASLSEPVHIEHYSERVAVPEARSGGSRRWLPLAIAALAALGLLMFLKGRTPRTADNIAVAKDALSSVALPGGATISVPENSINYNLARFLADGSAQAPRTFVFDHLNFETASTQLTPDSTATVTDLAQVLKAYPNARVELVGHTDSTGTPEANQTLSLNRADAVKGMLISNGVAAGQVSTAGFGQDKPVASNDTEEGRARNRRLELNVTSK